MTAGCMRKKIDGKASPYVGGRTRSWLKVKVPGWTDPEDRWKRVRIDSNKVRLGYVAQLEMGMKKKPSLEILKRLARALGVPVGESVLDGRGGGALPLLPPVRRAPRRWPWPPRPRRC